MSNVTRILIVAERRSDYELAQREISNSLKHCVFEQVETAAQFVESLDMFQPDLILADYFLPGSGGWEVLRLVQEHVPLTPLIIWSNPIGDDQAVDYIKAGAANFVLKENLPRLVTAVLQALEEKPLLQKRRDDEMTLRSLRTITEDMHELICRFKPDGTLTYVNQVYCDYYGKTRSELIGTNFIAVAQADFPQKLTEHFQSLSPENPVKSFEQYEILPNGKKRWRDWVDRGIFDENGNLTEIQATGRDVTARREIEEKYQDIFENSPVGIFQSTPDGQYLNLNPALANIYGYSSPQEMKENVQDIANQIYVDPRDREQFKSVLHAQDAIEEFEMPNRRKDGSIFWSSTSARTVRDAQGNILYYEGFLRDISASKEAEEALKQSQARYHDLFESSPISLWEEDYSLLKKRIEALQASGITDINAYLSAHPEVIIELTSLVKVTDVNRASLEIYHAKQKEDLLTSLSALFVEETLEHFQSEIMGLMSPAARFTWEGKDRTLDDEPIMILVHGSIAPGCERDWSKIIVSIIDITERKKAEEALRESEARFSNAFEYAPIGKGLVSLEGNFMKVNQVLCELLGYSEEQLKTKTFQELTHPEDLEADLNHVAKLLAGELTSYQMEKRYFHKDGHIVWVLLTVSLVKDADGHPQYFIAQVQDITERKRAEEIGHRVNETTALLETSLALTNLDLNAILQTIGSSAQNLFAADGCRIFLIQPDDDSLRCVLALQEDFVAFSDLKLKMGEGVTGTVAASGKAEIVNEMQNDPRSVLVPGTPEEEEEAVMFAPLKERDRTIGVISIRRAGSDRPFASTDLELLEAFASMAASAVSNARLFEEAQHRLSELEALYENGLAVGQLREPREIGERVIETFARYLSWHHVTIRLLDPETNQLELIDFNLPGLSDEERLEAERHFKKLINKPGQGLSGQAVQIGLPIRTGNVHSHSEYVDTQAGIESGLYMPMKIRDRVIGVISVESERPDAFTEQDERLLATLANQAAVAFENARLYQAAHEELLERTRAQAALWASETHYRELADSITDVLFELDHNLRLTHWNKASEMLTGIPEEDAIGKSMYKIFGESEAQHQLGKLYEQVLVTRQARMFETKLLLEDRKLIFEVNVYPSTRGVSVVAQNITERKVDEALLQKRFELMEYSARHSLDELMQKTIDEVSELTDSHIGFLHFVEEDQQTIHMQAWSSETHQQMEIVAAQGTHHPLTTAGIWADALRQKRPVIHNDYPSVADKKGIPDDHLNIIREMVIPILRDDRTVAVLGIGNKPQEYTQHDIEIAMRFADYAWDITERKRMESILADERNQLARRVEERTADLSRANSNLARALRVKDEFLANMSHELRTPLNAILGLSESLGEQVAGPLNEKQQKYLNTINESGHHLLSLINDILDLAKIEAGQITLDINKVDVNSVCQASLRMIKQLAQKKDQQVEFEIDDDLGLMWADERRLKQMMVNLLSNAVKFTPQSGALGLEVHGDRAGNRVIITVWDEGIGISEQDVERLFRPFVQLDSGLARETTGTGLGLALVAQMARLHGGSVSVQSQVGEGSRFSISLPWEPALAADASLRLRNTGKFRAIDPNAIEKPTILIIEDTREVIMMLTDYLEMSGFRIVTAQDGTDGLLQAKLSHPNLILMDIMMPGMDGFETTRRLRMDPDFRDTPIIALTALAMPNDRKRCLDAGMDEYISKPVNLRALTKLIQNILLDKEGKVR
jgi:PAS domain S-box-containing protein